MLVNVEHIISVRTALNGRLYARMENGEEILITRRYAKEVEDCFMEDGDDVNCTPCQGHFELV